MIDHDQIIQMAKDAGLTVATNISGVQLVGSPLPSINNALMIAHISVEELERFAALTYAAGQRDMREKAADYCGDLSSHMRSHRDSAGAEIAEMCEADIRALQIEGEKE